MVLGFFRRGKPEVQNPQVSEPSALEIETRLDEIWLKETDKGKLLDELWKLTPLTATTAAAATTATSSSSSSAFAASEAPLHDPISPRCRGTAALGEDPAGARFRERFIEVMGSWKPTPSDPCLPLCILSHLCGSLARLVDALTRVDSTMSCATSPPPPYAAVATCLTCLSIVTRGALNVRYLVLTGGLLTTLARLLEAIVSGLWPLALPIAYLQEQLHAERTQHGGVEATGEMPPGTQQQHQRLKKRTSEVLEEKYAQVALRVDLLSQCASLIARALNRESSELESRCMPTSELRTPLTPKEVADVALSGGSPLAKVMSWSLIMIHTHVLHSLKPDSHSALHLEQLQPLEGHADDDKDTDDKDDDDKASCDKPEFGSSLTEASCNTKLFQLILDMLGSLSLVVRPDAYTPDQSENAARLALLLECEVPDALVTVLRWPPEAAFCHRDTGKRVTEEQKETDFRLVDREDYELSPLSPRRRDLYSAVQLSSLGVVAKLLEDFPGSLRKLVELNFTNACGEVLLWHVLHYTGVESFPAIDAAIKSDRYLRVNYYRLHRIRHEEAYFHIDNASDINDTPLLPGVDLLDVLRGNQPPQLDDLFDLMSDLSATSNGMRKHIHAQVAKRIANQLHSGDTSGEDSAGSLAEERALWAIVDKLEFLVLDVFSFLFHAHNSPSAKLRSFGFPAGSDLDAMDTPVIPPQKPSLNLFIALHHQRDYFHLQFYFLSVVLSSIRQQFEKDVLISPGHPSHRRRAGFETSGSSTALPDAAGAHGLPSAHSQAGRERSAFDILVSFGLHKVLIESDLFYMSAFDVTANKTLQQPLRYRWESSASVQEPHGETVRTCLKQLTRYIIHSVATHIGRDIRLDLGSLLLLLKNMKYSSVIARDISEALLVICRKRDTSKGIHLHCASILDNMGVPGPGTGASAACFPQHFITVLAQAFEAQHELVCMLQGLVFTPLHSCTAFGSPVASEWDQTPSEVGSDFPGHVEVSRLQGRMRGMSFSNSEKPPGLHPRKHRASLPAWMSLRGRETSQILFSKEARRRKSAPSFTRASTGESFLHRGDSSGPAALESALSELPVRRISSIGSSLHSTPEGGLGDASAVTLPPLPMDALGSSAIVHTVVTPRGAGGASEGAKQPQQQQSACSLQSGVGPESGGGAESAQASPVLTGGGSSGAAAGASGAVPVGQSRREACGARHPPPSALWGQQEEAETALSGLSQEYPVGLTKDDLPAHLYTRNVILNVFEAVYELPVMQQLALQPPAVDVLISCLCNEPLRAFGVRQLTFLLKQAGEGQDYTTLHRTLSPAMHHLFHCLQGGDRAIITTTLTLIRDVLLHLHEEEMKQLQSSTSSGASPLRGPDTGKRKRALQHISDDSYLKILATLADPGPVPPCAKKVRGALLRTIGSPTSPPPPAGLRTPSSTTLMESNFSLSMLVIETLGVMLRGNVRSKARFSAKVGWERVVDDVLQCVSGQPRKAIFDKLFEVLLDGTQADGAGHIENEDVLTVILQLCFHPCFSSDTALILSLAKRVKSVLVFSTHNLEKASRVGALETLISMLVHWDDENIRQPLTEAYYRIGRHNVAVRHLKPLFGALREQSDTQRMFLLPWVIRILRNLAFNAKDDRGLRGGRAGDFSQTSSMQGLSESDTSLMSKRGVSLYGSSLFGLGMMSAGGVSMSMTGSSSLGSSVVGGDAAGGSAAGGACRNSAPTAFFDFSGVRSGISVPDAAYPSSNGYSVALWFRVESFTPPALSDPSDSELLGLYMPHLYSMCTKNVSEVDFSSFSAFFRCNRLCLSVKVGQETKEICVESMTFDAHRWYHLVVTHACGTRLIGKSETARVFVDGAEVWKGALRFPKTGARYHGYIAADMRGGQGKTFFSNLSGQISAVYFIDSPINFNTASAMYDVGPRYLGGFSRDDSQKLKAALRDKYTHIYHDFFLSPKIYMLFNPLVAHENMLLNVMSLSHMNDLGTTGSGAHEDGRLALILKGGTQLCITQNLSQVLESIGGMPVLFPLLAFLGEHGRTLFSGEAAPGGSEDRIPAPRGDLSKKISVTPYLVSNLLSLLTDLYKADKVRFIEEWQAWRLTHVLNMLLKSIAPHLDKGNVERISVLIWGWPDEAWKDGLMYLLLDFSIWGQSPLPVLRDLLVQLVSMAQHESTRRKFRAAKPLQYLLEQICWFLYYENPPVYLDADSVRGFVHIPAPLMRDVTLRERLHGKRMIEKEDDIKQLRKEVFPLVQLLLHTEAPREEDISALLASILSPLQDALQQSDLLDLLLELLERKKGGFVKLFLKLGGLPILVNLLSHPKAFIRQGGILCLGCCLKYSKDLRDELRTEKVNGLSVAREALSQHPLDEQTYQCLRCVMLGRVQTQSLGCKVAMEQPCKSLDTTANSFARDLSGQLLSVSAMTLDIPAALLVITRLAISSSSFEVKHFVFSDTAYLLKSSPRIAAKLAEMGWHLLVIELLLTLTESPDFLRCFPAPFEPRSMRGASVGEGGAASEAEAERSRLEGLIFAIFDCALDTLSRIMYDEMKRVDKAWRLIDETLTLINSQSFFFTQYEVAHSLLSRIVGQYTFESDALPKNKNLVLTNMAYLLFFVEEVLCYGTTLSRQLRRHALETTSPFEKALDKPLCTTTGLVVNSTDQDWTVVHLRSGPEAGGGSAAATGGPGSPRPLPSPRGGALGSPGTEGRCLSPVPSGGGPMAPESSPQLPPTPMDAGISPRGTPGGAGALSSEQGSVPPVSLSPGSANMGQSPALPSLRIDTPVGSGADGSPPLGSARGGAQQQPPGSLGTASATASSSKKADTYCEREELCLTSVEVDESGAEIARPAGSPAPSSGSSDAHTWGVRETWSGWHLGVACLSLLAKSELYKNTEIHWKDDTDYSVKGAEGGSDVKTFLGRSGGLTRLFLKLIRLCLRYHPGVSLFPTPKKIDASYVDGLHTALSCAKHLIKYDRASEDYRERFEELLRPKSSEVLEKEAKVRTTVLLQVLISFSRQFSQPPSVFNPGVPDPTAVRDFKILHRAVGKINLLLKHRDGTLQALFGNSEQKTKAFILAVTKRLTGPVPDSNNAAATEASRITQAFHEAAVDLTATDPLWQEVAKRMDAVQRYIERECGQEVVWLLQRQQRTLMSIRRLVARNCETIKEVLLKHVTGASEPLGLPAPILPALYRDLSRTSEKHWRLLVTSVTGQRGVWATEDVFESVARPRLVKRARREVGEIHCRIRPRLVADAKLTNHSDAASSEQDAPRSDLKQKAVKAVRQKGDAADQPSEGNDGEAAEQHEPVEEEDIEDVPDLTSMGRRYPCEVISLMQGWSGTLQICGNPSRYLWVLVDEENQAIVQAMGPKADRLVEKPKDDKFSVDTIEYIALRRYRMVYSALEFYFTDRTSVLVNLPAKESAVQVMKTILFQISPRPAALKTTELPKAPMTDLKKSKLTERWVRREISNFEYLMALNHHASRTFNDLTQYPVMPWVLCDYTSKELDLEDESVYRDLSLPMGCLGIDGQRCQSRIDDLNLKYTSLEGMGMEPYHYGSHYSNSGFALFYLVRMEPYTTGAMILQGGHFDHADRMFDSLHQTWYGVTHTSADVKELIPEFFCQPEILTNNNTVQFGTRQDGRALNNVELPPWASSPHEFVRIHREALESEHVSQNLHLWIDMIFGYRQVPTKEGLNTYHPYAYEDIVKELTDGDVATARGIISHIDNFGQTPAQLFRKKHPQRSAVVPIFNPLKALPSALVPQSALYSIMKSRVVKLYLSNDLLIGIDSTGAVVVHSFRAGVSVTEQQAGSLVGRNPDAPVAASSASVVPSDVGGAQAAELQTRRQATGRRGFHFDSQPACQSRPVQAGMQKCALTMYSYVLASLPERHLLISSGLWNNTATISELVTGPNSTPNVIQTLSGHHGVVTCLALSDDYNYLVTGSQDTMLRLYRLRLKGSGQPAQFKATLFGHEEPVLCVAINPAFDIVVSGSSDGTAILYSISEGKYEATLPHPLKNSIDLVVSTATGATIFYSKADLWLHTYSINGKLLHSAEAGKLHTMTLTKDSRFLLCGGAGRESRQATSYLALRSSHDLSLLYQFTDGPSSPVRSIAIHNSNQVLAVGLEDGSLLFYSLCL